MSGRLLPLLLWAAFLATVLGSGSWRLYVVGWHWWLLLAAAVLLAGLVAAACAAWRAPAGHAHGPRPGAAGILVHGLPLLVLIAVGPSALGQHALGGVAATAPTAGAPASAPRPPSARPAAAGLAPTPMTLADLHAAVQRDEQVLVTVVGRIHHPDVAQLVGRLPRLRPDDARVAIFRHQITCCAADARSLVALLRVDRVPDLPADTWVEVTGWVGPPVTSSRGYLPIIEVDAIAPIEAPADVYLRRTRR